MLVLRVAALSLFSLLFSLLFLGGCGGASAQPKPEVAGMCKDVPAPACVRGRTVVIVRHAEKSAEGGKDGGKDPSLSERGQVRARTLAGLLAPAGVTKILATPYKRTQETVTPLAQKLGLQVESMPPEKMRDAIKAAPDGAVVVLATHSNLIPALVQDLADAKLKGVTGDALAEDDFSRVILITQPCGATHPTVTELGSTVE